MTVNLCSAIRHLRRYNIDRTIWADALCINQQDVEERSAQVLEMGNIYGSANRVLIWLGDATPDTELGFRFLQDMPHATSKPGESESCSDTKTWQSGMDDCSWDFLERPWWDSAHNARLSVTTQHKACKIFSDDLGGAGYGLSKKWLEQDEILSSYVAIARSLGQSL